MTEIVKEINHFLQWYKTIYGNELFIDENLAIAEPGAAEYKAKIVPSKKNTKKRMPYHQKVHGNNPELKAFFEEINTCQKCALGKSRNNFVFGMGNPAADIMFIGEAPGRDEDIQGLPFVGRAGKLLDKMFQAIGLNREDVYIANVLKCRPPNNRDPLPDEVIQCEPYLKKQINLIRPKVIVALGRISAQVLLKTSDSLSMLRNTQNSYENIPFIVTYHPAALLRNPRWKANSWQDLIKIKSYI